MRPMPRLWRYLTQDWLTLEPDLARAWWYAVATARWSVATAWREQFLAFARQDGLVTADVVDDFLAQVATLAQLVQVLEALAHERRLLARDKRQIEEALFAQADAHGHWKKGVGHRG